MPRRTVIQMLGFFVVIGLAGVAFDFIDASRVMVKVLPARTAPGLFVVVDVDAIVVPHVFVFEREETRTVSARPHRGFPTGGPSTLRGSGMGATARFHHANGAAVPRPGRIDVRATLASGARGQGPSGFRVAFAAAPGFITQHAGLRRGRGREGEREKGKISM